ncbi:cobyric acid synthase [Trichlorobacter lovleyi]|uniref:Cobyric acid synthase n=1 Tax=Trichlorobacter lovleyi (strain ATCC BAA-1151 / DSM 17278 / SZ) TaxID=398767 RepID=B3EBU6_TRIL1|nr:cobyric acid synthase [Trichlorobacter lovleyi]ACD97378.1 cobyric acid synthase CobQ [Trichlorobacter lovleyi SZ]
MPDQLPHSEQYRHGGNLRALSRLSGRAPHELLDFSANINPLGPPDWLRPLIESRISELVHYPDPEASELVAAISTQHRIPAAELLVGNGATELLHLLPRALGCSSLLLPVPSYSDYEAPARLQGLAVERFTLVPDNDFLLDPQQLAPLLKPGQMVLLGQPNNPTGRTFAAAALRDLAASHPASLFVVDESFIGFTDASQSLQQDRPANLLVVTSLTKLYAIPGLRLGYLTAAEAHIQKLRAFLPTWSVNSLAQAVGARAVQDQDYLQQTRSMVTQQRQQLAQMLGQLPGLTIYPGEANFLLLRLDHSTLDAPQLAEQTLKQGIALRICANFQGLDQRYLRVAVRTETEQQQLCGVLHAILEPTRQRPARRQTPAIMFQGTGSNAGKSILTTALCRILKQDGHDVAPFKAQNMSLNAFVTPQGGEMGRAQALQAQACRLEPDVRMNPVLLKPTSETGSQVILCGKVQGSTDFRSYAQQRQQVWSTVQGCYDELAAEHQVMVLEGAGSPAEVNLKTNDIVNMRMAQYAGAPVLLVGDIDRGGVFASFVGTMELLNEAERHQVAGFVINRFRGDASLLGDALAYTRFHTSKPVLGTVPYLTNLGLPEEDSVTFKQGLLPCGAKDTQLLDIAVLNLPHVANFTDLDPLGQEPDVGLRLVRSAAELGQPDAVLIPGSKNTLADLAWLQQTGLATAILELAQAGQVEIIGICGGFQILGERIGDPLQIESTVGEQQGLGLLAISTVLAEQKTTRQTRCCHIPSGCMLSGYEIHHGITSADQLQPLMSSPDGSLLGAGDNSGLVWGSYLHGLFDADPFRRWWLDRLRQRKGWQVSGVVRACYNLEPALDRLADCVRDSLDMREVYRLLGI